MCIVGIDPGTARLGWGVLEETNGALQPLAHGVIETPAHQPLEQRLLTLYHEVTTLLDHYHPTVAAIESLFFSRNVSTALAVGHARGVVLLAFAQASLPVFEYTPKEVKQALSGYGGATKRQVQEMVKLTLGLAKIPKPDDAADALAVAICHAYTAPLRRRIAESEEL